jgi:hypothetical protein
MPDSLQDQKKEKLLYLRSKPSKSLMLDSLPGVVFFDEDGKVKAYPAKFALLIMILPLATLVGHGIYLFTVFG